MVNIYDRNSDRLHTTDERGNRVYIHPDDIGGVWRTRRTIVYFFLMLLFVIAPWIKINGQPLILFNLIERKFALFGMVFWGHDVPLLIFLLLGFIFSFGIITSLYGRIWCGWMCPQTVFIDRVFRPIERLVEGSGRARMKLDAQPWNFEKLWKRTLKWFLYICASFVITHTFLSYFIGAYSLQDYIFNRPTEHWAAFISMLVLNGIFLFDFAWFREQFCIIMCPYGRIQSVMMDSNSLVVAYDEKRGEPRKNPALVRAKQPLGDCVNCYQCVRVCPTGIDIRNGVQLECIACSACIDACDNIMTKLKRPTGLISYTTENQLAGQNLKKFNLRTAIYSIILTFVVVLAGFQVNKTTNLRVLFLKAGKEPFKIVKFQEQEKILNHFKVEFFYNGEKPREIYFDSSLKDVELITPQTPYHVKPGRKRVTHLFLRFSKEILKNGQKSIELKVLDKSKSEILRKEVYLVGPF